MIQVELPTQRRRTWAAVASGYTCAPKRVVKLVEENVESLCLDRRNGGDDSSDRVWPVCVMQPRCEIFGDIAIEAEDNLLAHGTYLT